MRRRFSDDHAVSEAERALRIDIARTLAWPALLRKLDRIDPSYRD